MATPGSPANANYNKVAAGEFIGRDVKFAKLNWTGIETSYTTADSNFAKAVRVLGLRCTITIVGTPASDNVVFLVEGLASGNVADNVDGTVRDIAAALKAEVEASIGGTATWTIYNGLSGTTFA